MRSDRLPWRGSWSFHSSATKLELGSEEERGFDLLLWIEGRSPIFAGKLEAPRKSAPKLELGSEEGGVSFCLLPFTFLLKLRGDRTVNLRW